MTILVSIETVLLILIALLVAGMLRTHGEILRALRLGPSGEESEAAVPTRVGPPANVDEQLLEPAADVVGVNLELRPLSVSMESNQNTLLGFLSSGCLSCVRFWEALSSA